MWVQFQLLAGDSSTTTRHATRQPHPNPRSTQAAVAGVMFQRYSLNNARRRDGWMTAFQRTPV
ncbi:hypothetical protein KCP70_16970 [Salmonella enterica subsp. enterica]|nr:hypothetical protein KCP70_16970 [Salmonella enterica subsp. enterica]